MILLLVSITIILNNLVILKVDGGCLNHLTLPWLLASAIYDKEFYK